MKKKRKVIPFIIFTKRKRIDAFTWSDDLIKDTIYKMYKRGEIDEKTFRKNLKRVRKRRKK